MTRFRLSASKIALPVELLGEDPSRLGEEAREGLVASGLSVTVPGKGNKKGNRLRETDQDSERSEKDSNRGVGTMWAVGVRNGRGERVRTPEQG